MSQRQERERRLHLHRQRQRSYAERRRSYGIPTSAQVNRAITRAVGLAATYVEPANLKCDDRLVRIDALADAATDLLACWGYEPTESRRLIIEKIGAR